jgi:fumarate hydratase class I
MMHEHFLELIRRTSTHIPADISAAIKRGRDNEEKGSPAYTALDDILKNCDLAHETSRPICQDTGTNIWYVYRPSSLSEKFLTEEILKATREATEKAYLRPNAVDSITGKNSGDNTGFGAPVIHFHEWDKEELVVDLLLKGGGSENVSAQYSLPDSTIKAGRDLEGIRKSVVDAVFKAQGRGCGPGFIGVGVGGDRATCMIEAKEQLSRLLDDSNPDATLDKLEKQLFEECNSLMIGPMGFGGKTTVLGVKIGKRHRLPASFFVSVAYLCWAARRASVSIKGETAEYSEISQIASRYNLSK